MRKLKILGICAALLLVQLFSNASFVRAADIVTDILITGYSTYNTTGGTKNTIVTGDEFRLDLTIQNNGGAGNLDGLYVIVGAGSSFYGASTNTFNYATGSNSVSLANNASTTISMNLIYRGTGNELDLTFKYKLGGAPKPDLAQSVFIKNAYPIDTSTSTPVDTSKYVPKLNTTAGSSAITAYSGVSNKLVLPIKNSSTYAAKNVVVSAEMTDSAKAAQVLDNFNLTGSIDQIQNNETKNVSFDLVIRSEAPPGNYPFKISYSFLNSSGDSFTSSETIYIKVVNTNTSPRLVVDGVETTPSAAVPGEKVSVRVKITNLGTLPSRDVKVTLKGLKSTGFVTDNSSEIQYVSTIRGSSSVYVTYALKASSGIPSGSNELQVKLDYKDDSSGAAISDESQIFVPVSRNGGGTGLVIKDIQSPQGAMTANKDFHISFTLANTSLADISNIKVSLSGDKEIVCKSMNTFMLDSLGKGQSKKFSFTLFATSDAVKKNYPLSINVEYGDAQGDTAAKQTISQYVGVFVDNGSGKSVPRIIIDKYSYEPQEIKSGDEFTLKMSFQNTSRMVDIQNLKITVSSDDGAFTPINSSNTFFVDTLPMKKSMQEVLVLKAKPGAEPKAYPLSISFDYEDDKGNPYNTKETISIPVQQNPRLVIGDINLPTEAYTGQPVGFSVEFYNMGKVTLYNFMIKAEGDFTAQNARYFVGNFDPGHSDTFEAQVTPKAAGEMKGKIIFAYEDVAGKAIEVTKEFSVNVMDMPEQPPTDPSQGAVGPDGKPLNPKAGKGFNILFVVIPAGVVVLGIITFVVIRKKRIKRRELSIDE